MKRNIIKLGLKIPMYILFRELGWPVILPFNYTLSITYKCNSRCRTCNIWKLSGKMPEMSTDEWLKIIKSLGNSPFWITISGGEPLLRRDLEILIEGIKDYNNPTIINLPTNGLVRSSEKIIENILKICDDIKVIINFSLDGIGKEHDYIRGVKGNWNLFLENYKKVKYLKNKYDNLIVGIHTVISKWNVNNIENIVSYIINRLQPDQYITEIAEIRKEMNNEYNPPTPAPEDYSRAVDILINIIENGFKNGRWKGFAKITESLRIEYYKYVRNIYLNKKNFYLKSYAGFASCQIAPNGDVWECAVYATSLGNLKEYDYDFKKLWKSERANEVRKIVKRGHICPLANENYVNMLFSPRIILKAMLRLLK